MSKELLPDTDTLASKAFESVDFYHAIWTPLRQTIVDTIKGQEAIKTGKVQKYPRYEGFLKHDEHGNEWRTLYWLSSMGMPFDPHSLSIQAADEDIYGVET